MKFWITDAFGTTVSVSAKNFAEAAATIETGSRNIYGVEGKYTSRFYIDRGRGGPLYPIGARTAALELSMGGF